LRILGFGIELAGRPAAGLVVFVGRAARCQKVATQSSIKVRMRAGKDGNAGKLRIMNDPIEDSGDYSRTEPLRLTVPEASSGRRLDQVLAELLPQHSRNRLQGWVKEGCVQVDGHPETEPKRKVLGRALLISEPEDVRNQIDQPEDIPLDVVSRMKPCSSSTSRPGWSSIPAAATGAAR
jgi:hypothetical protein